MFSYFHSKNMFHQYILNIIVLQRLRRKRIFVDWIYILQKSNWRRKSWMKEEKYVISIFDACDNEKKNLAVLL